MARFIDINQNFIANPLTGDVSIVKDLAAINQAIKNIIIESAYDRPFRSRSKFADGIYSKIFESFHPSDVQLIKEDIFNKLLRHEPRILIQDVLVEGIPQEYKLSIEIIYRIRTTNNTTSFKFFLERA